MLNVLAFVGLPSLFFVDYLAIIVWLMKSTGGHDKHVRFSLRTLFIAMTVAAIHFGVFAAFLSFQPR